MDVDVLIIGGGIAGLWTLDQLRQRGYRAVLVENRELGYGQTITSQGIIHGGLKYSLRGVLTASANEIREMPLIWRECLSGQREPNLSSATVRSHCCYLWQTDSLASQAGMWGASIQLRVKPETISASHRPELLKQSPGNVYRLDEQVVSPGSVLQCLKKRNQDALLLCDQKQGIEFSRSQQGTINSVNIRCQGDELHLVPGCVVMTAGIGNQQLNEAAGRKQPMQRRPLQMVLVRGELEMFQGHCVDGAKTRMTITSEVISTGEVVWQLGGQVAELGVSMSAEELIQHAAKELQAILPGLNIESLKFATYQVDRAEKKISLGLRPDSPQVIKHKNLLTCWPTKLAFAPRAAGMIEEMITNQLNLKPSVIPGENENLWKDWPVPHVAESPWETVENWYQISGETVSSLPALPAKHAA